MEELVLASANPDKVAELRGLLGDHFVVVARPSGAPETIEDLDTLEGNAAKKAAEIARFADAAALADDTGLFVAALGGEPGVYSARYGGPDCRAEDNVAKLLSNLESSTDRAAYFETVVCISWPDGNQVLAHGRLEGTIATEPRGENGFGYDSVFVPDVGDGRTFGEMTAPEKAAISHRARALASLMEELAQGERS